MPGNAPYILYALSKDRTSQRLNGKGLEDILSELEVFLSTCTTSVITTPSKVKLTAYGPYDEKDPTELLDALIARTIDRLGDRPPTPLTYGAHSGQPCAAKKFVWELGPDKLSEAIQYLRELGPLPRSSFGPIELLISYDFRLVEPHSEQELPDQHHRSDMLVWFSRTASCAPTLYFPFAEAGPAFWNYVDAIKPHLPFTLEEKFLKVAHLNKQGQVRSFKKVLRPS